MRCKWSDSLLQEDLSKDSLLETIALQDRIQVETNFNFTNPWRDIYESHKGILTKSLGKSTEPFLTHGVSMIDVDQSRGRSARSSFASTCFS